jgi:hypothetical protein
MKRTVGNSTTNFLSSNVNIELVPYGGGFVFRVDEPGCRSKYLASGKKTCNIDEAVLLAGQIGSGDEEQVMNEITVDTYADVLAYNYTSEPVRINVLVDEDKGQNDTAYIWTGTVRKWAAEVVDDNQPA